MEGGSANTSKRNQPVKYYSQPTAGWLLCLFFFFFLPEDMHESFDIYFFKGGASLGAAGDFCS